MALPAQPKRRFLVLVRLLGGGAEVEVLPPSREPARIPIAEIDSVLAGAGESNLDLRNFCAHLGLDMRSAGIAERVLRRDSQRVELCSGFSFAPADSGFVARFIEAGGRPLLFGTVFFYVLAFTLYLVSWWLIGSAAMEGHLSQGWLWAWALMLPCFVICRGAAIWGAGRLAVYVGGITRERLLGGILRLSTDKVRAKGIGALLGVVLDADALDALARTGGPTLLADVAQCACGLAVLLAGVAPVSHAVLFVSCLGLAGYLVRRLYRRLLDWADARLALTDDLVEDDGWVPHHGGAAGAREAPPRRRTCTGRVRAQRGCNG